MTGKVSGCPRLPCGWRSRVSPAAADCFYRGFLDGYCENGGVPHAGDIGKASGCLSPAVRLEAKGVPKGRGALSKVPCKVVPYLGWPQIKAYCFYCN